MKQQIHGTMTDKTLAKSAQRNAFVYRIAKLFCLFRRTIHMNKTIKKV